MARAKEYVTAALEHAFALGKGPGPVHHFYAWWEGGRLISHNLWYRPMASFGVSMLRPMWGRMVL